MLNELQARNAGGRFVHWPRGVGATVFHPRHREASVYTGLPGPVWLYVGRVAVEKSLEDFLGLPLPGTKVVVGDGPSREPHQRRYPEVVWRGYRFGDDLAAHFASADCFVFPSRTETFGNVLLEVGGEAEAGNVVSAVERLSPSRDDVLSYRGSVILPAYDASSHRGSVILPAYDASSYRGNMTLPACDASS